MAAEIDLDDRARRWRGGDQLLIDRVYKFAAETIASSSNNICNPLADTGNTNRNLLIEVKTDLRLDAKSGCG